MALQHTATTEAGSCGQHPNSRLIRVAIALTCGAVVLACWAIVLACGAVVVACDAVILAG